MIVYKTTNLVNGKIYIGRDCGNNSNYYGSGKHYQRAEKKYGKENFRKAIIDSSDDFKELCLKEVFWVDFYNARNVEIGYNIAPGGEGFMNGNKHPLYGKPLSEETKQKIATALKGRIKSEEHLYKISIATRGRRPSDETRLKLKKASLGNKNSLGFKHSEETKQKMSLAAKGKAKSEEHRSNIRKSLILRHSKEVSP